MGDKVYIIVMEDEVFGLRCQLRVFKTWDAADEQAVETARLQKKICWVAEIPNPHFDKEEKALEDA